LTQLSCLCLSCDAAMGWRSVYPALICAGIPVRADGVASVMRLRSTGSLSLSLPIPRCLYSAHPTHHPSHVALLSADFARFVIIGNLVQLNGLSENTDDHERRSKKSESCVCKWAKSTCAPC